MFKLILVNSDISTCPVSCWSPRGESRVFIANLLDCVGRASQRPAFCYVNLHREEYTEWEDLPMDKTVDFDSWDKDKHCGDRMDVTTLLANRI